MTSVIKSNVTSADDLITPITEELTQISSVYIICFGQSVAQYFSKNKIELSNANTNWQEISLFQRNTVLITIPTINEMISDPRYKKGAWALLKKVADQIHQA